jgi:peptidoglycan-N-acetylglucosamine deacetylase
MKNLVLFAAFFAFAGSSFSQTTGHPKICFTFDDGNTNDILTYKQENWNALILKQLEAENIQAVLFACGKGLNDTKGRDLLSSWDKAGHLIANHTFSHKNYNSANTSFLFFKTDFLRNDSLINAYKHYSKLFRFPFLKEGNTIEKRDSMRAFLKSTGYSNGYVTIDASDWYYDSRLIATLNANPAIDLSKYKQAYLEHILDRAMYYDSLASVLTGRKIHHTLLLHHNLASALFLGDLIKMFKDKGWEMSTPAETFADEIYSKAPDIIPAGESLVWALAKQSGKFEKMLRYPAEDSVYEKEKLDRIGR